MSCVCILTPVVIAAWPSFSAAVVAAAASLGYHTLMETEEQAEHRAVSDRKRVSLQMDQSEIVTSKLGRDQKISVARDGVVVTFARDPRGKASLCVEGKGHSEAALRAMGEELSRRVIQKYVYQRLVDEIHSRQFNIVEEETTEDNSIRLKIRHWEN